MNKKDFKNPLVSSGFSIVEVLTAVVISSFVMFSLCVGYLTIVNMWAGYSHQSSSDAAVWLIYNKINAFYKNNILINQIEPAKWVFINSKKDSTFLENFNDTLKVNDKIIKIDGHMKDFKIVKSNRPGKHLVWENSYTCFYRKKSSGLKWYSVCSENSISNTLPQSNKDSCVDSDMYWDQKE